MRYMFLILQSGALIMLQRGNYFAKEFDFTWISSISLGKLQNKNYQKNLERHGVVQFVEVLQVIYRLFVRYQERIVLFLTCKSLQRMQHILEKRCQASNCLVFQDMHACIQCNLQA
eukprot:TRINITY_DN22948_c0_g1_i11.p4 TRINITY_DN22948_c0_g1~~TRINITY_DN22948_c0_g1_i11.p4  ORF type:complete len:116 (-),score=2.94 TRINITY_DN22948_c0_g1_i11:31-378(-)